MKLSIFLLVDGKNIKKHDSKLIIVTVDFLLEDSRNAKEEKDWLYPQQIIEAIKNCYRLDDSSHTIYKFSKL